MTIYFIRDARHKFRLFSSESDKDIPLGVSRSKKMWELAKKKLLLLPPRSLRQEQAFISALKNEEESVQIIHSGRRPERRLKLRFSLFLQKQRSKHVLFLVGETLLLPISGLATLIPGPNVFFAALALLMITHWQALRGINRLAGKRHEFLPAPLFSEWENAVELSQENCYPEILHRLEAEYHLPQLNRILWK
jgi:hypothetical protein